ncbi:hypothetical protein EON79_01090 [bacterium]|nr:MAG: hypothetical protein EON79_01090 [bacterium]
MKIRTRSFKKGLLKFVHLGGVMVLIGCGTHPAPPPINSSVHGVNFGPVDDAEWKKLEARLPTGFKIGIGGKGAGDEPLGSVDVKAHGRVAILAQGPIQEGLLTVVFTPKAGGEARTTSIADSISDMSLPPGDYRVAVRGTGPWRIGIYR